MSTLSRQGRSTVVHLIGLALAALTTGCDGPLEVPASCAPYPKELIGRFDCPRAPEAATTGLGAINGSALGNWDPLRCTYGELRQLAIPLPGCAGAEPVAAHFFAAVAEHQGVFQLAPGEFSLETRPLALACEGIVATAQSASSPTQGHTTATLVRVAYAGAPFHALAGMVQFSVDAGAVFVDEITSMKNLVVRADLAAEFTACEPAPDTALEARVRSHSYSYTGWVEPLGGLLPRTRASRTYTPRENDAVEWLDDGPWTEWNGELRRVRGAGLVIAKSNWPADVDALACGASDAGWLVFEISIDAVTGEVLDWRALPSCFID